MSAVATIPTLADQIAEAILYEGHILYPYRASSRKRREPCTIGRVYPISETGGHDNAEPFMQTQCLARIGHGAGPRSRVHGRIRFLHSMAREICEARTGSNAETSPVVPSLRIGNRTYNTWIEAVEREVVLPEVSLEASSSRVIRFGWEGMRTVEPIHSEEAGDSKLLGFIRRKQRAIRGEIGITVEAVCEDVARITIQVRNFSPITPDELGDPQAVVLAAFASTHTILEAEGGEFISLLDPPAECALAATGCENIGTWPVLVGDEEAHERTTILSSPVILYDYPRITADSAVELHGEMESGFPSLRTVTMTGEEHSLAHGGGDFELQAHADASNPHGLDHDYAPGGQWNDFLDGATRITDVMVGGVAMQAGDYVRIKPRNPAGTMDLMLAGKVGIIEAIEQDVHGHVQLAIMLEGDPGHCLGMLRHPGRRFFYALNEVEPVELLEEE